MNYRIKHLKEYVESLTPAEKWYFNYFCKAFATSDSDPLYLQFFSGLSDGSFELDSDRKKYSKQGLTSAKRKIFQRLSDVMLFFHRDYSVEMTIRNHIGKVEIFFHNHNLPEQADFILQKAIALARKNELFDLLLSCLMWERKLCLVLPQPSRPLEAIVDEEHDIYEKLLQISQLERIFMATRKFKGQHGYVSGALVDELAIITIGAGGMPTEDACRSAKAGYYRNFVYALYYWMVQDHRSSYNHTRQLLNREMQAILPNDYLDGILEHVTASFCVASFQEALTGLEVAAVYSHKYKLDTTYSLKLSAYRMVYRLMIYNLTGNLPKLQEVIAETENEISNHGGELSQATTQVVMGNLMNAYIGIGDTKRAYEIWSRLFRRNARSIRADVYDSLYLFRLFYLLQTETYGVLPGLALSAYRYYTRARKSEDQFTLELKVSLLLKKDYSYDDKKVRAHVVQVLTKMFDEFIKGIKGADGFQEFYTFYHIWLQSMTSGMPYHECARQWYLKRKQFPNLESI